MSEWNKISLQYNFYSLLLDYNIEREFWKIVEKYLVGGNSIFYEESKKLRDCYDDWIIFKIYFNGYERICCVINIGILDEMYLYFVFYLKIKDILKYCYLYFEYFRKIKVDNDMFIEIENVLKRFNVI